MRLKGVIIAGLLCTRWLCAGQGFDFGNYQVVSSAPLGGSSFEYVLKVSVTNRAAHAAGVSAQVFSTATNTIIVAGLVGFGDVAFGQSAPSTNTFKVRQVGPGLFNPAPLQWFVSVQSMPLSVSVDTPVNALLTNGTNVLVSGSVGPAVDGVTVGRTNVPLTAGHFSALIPLEEGRNIITAVATNAFGGSGAANVTVNRDTTAPFLSIETPTNGTIAATRQITFTGQINDAVPGTVNPEQATVTVNGVTAALLNRSYAASDVLLAPGTNRIVVVGRDRAGNETPKEIEVIFRQPASQKRLVALAGDGQASFVGANLSEPLLVELVDQNGVVQTNQPVTFSVTRGDGAVLAPPDSGRTLTLPTDDKGRASVVFRLGTRAGSGNNQVEVSSPGVQAPLTFSAHGLGAAPARVSPLIPETQVGEVGKPLAQPWTALVTDVEGNPVQGAPLTFLLMHGGGSFGGQTMLTTNTDSDGRASAVLTLGPEPGVNNHVAVAMVAGAPNSAATFVASAQTPQAVPNTRVVGLVLDNANRPMSNVLCIIYRTFLAAVTDANGRFVISNAPVGAIRLLVDARERGYPGDWHALEFDLVTVAGHDNSVDRPIYMLPLDSDNAAMAGGSQDVQLRLKGIPGATMTVFANSVRDNSGHRITNRVSWTEVNQERVPMVPPKGAQFSLAWTVQPPGLRFDPPARICIPNAGQNPGQILEMFGFDHDLGAFVSLGTGTVTPDGSQVCSDSGFGVTKSGWGGFVPPRPPCCAVCGDPKTDPLNIQPAAGGPLCFDLIFHPGSSSCDCARLEKRPKRLVSNVAARINGKEQAFGGTNTIFNFTVTSDHPECASLTYAWDFGDGEKSTVQNPTHKFAARRTYHPKVIVGCQTCPESKATNEVTAVVEAINLIVHRPKRIDPSESEIPHDRKLTVGGQTFENLDNDDGSTAFDINEASFVGEDDELMKVRIQIPAEVDPGSTVRFEVTQGAENIRLWQTATKIIEFNPSNALQVTSFTDAIGGKEYALFVEGIRSHTTQRGTRFKARLLTSTNELDADEAAITVLGLSELAWEGIFNSAANLTAFDSNHPLDLDPNWPAADMAGLPPAVRVFPDARVEVNGGVGEPRDKVRVRARLSVAPVEPVQFYFRAFDVDDPSDINQPVDNDFSSPVDNRGAGAIVGSDSVFGMLALTFDAQQLEKTFEFRTSMQPGDNFRIAGSADPGFLLLLANDDQLLHSLVNNRDKQRIVDPRISPPASNMELLRSTNYVTPTLTVWRFLHLETDSMRAPTEEELTVTTSFSGISNVPPFRVLTGVNLPPDLSKNTQMTGANFDNGRFERGKAVIGDGVTIPIVGNGNDEIVLQATNSIFPLTFLAMEDKLFFPTRISGVVTNIGSSGGNFVYQLQVTFQSSPLTNWSVFVGGTLRVGNGEPVPITAVDHTNSTLRSPAMNIPIKLWDDDLPNLPQPPDLAHLTLVLREIYVQLLEDGGGSPANNEQSVSFVLNTATNSVEDAEEVFQRQSGGSDAFWVGYLLQSFQYGLLQDRDPNSESGVGGVAFSITSNTSVAKGARGSQVFTETVRDRLVGGALAGLGTRVTAHEIGHQLGLEHWDVGQPGVPAGPVAPNLMLTTMESTPEADAKLAPMHKHLLRSRVKSPGK